MVSFLEELDKALGNMNGESRKEILDDFTEHFRLARKDGKSDEQIIAALGSPQSIAEQFLEPDGPNTGRQTSTPIGNSQRSEIYYSPDPDATVNEFDANGVERLHIDVNMAEVKIESDPHIQTIKTLIRVSDKKSTFQVFREGRSVEIIEKNPYSLFNFPHFFRKPSEVKVFVPAGSRHSIDIGTKFGNIELYNCSGDQLDVSCTFGDIRANSIEFDNLSINAKAGDVKLEQAPFKRTDIHTSAGEITVSGCLGILDAHTSAGNVKVKRHGGNVSVRSSAGNVSVDNSEGIIKAHSSAGNVRIDTLVSEYAEGSSSAGNVNFSAHEVKGLKLTAKTGNAKAQVDRLFGNAELSTGAGNVKLDANAVQGDINASSGAGTVEVILPRETAIRVVTRKGVGSLVNTLSNNEQSPYTLTASSSAGSVKLIGK